MSLSVLLTIYFLFLLTYGILMWFAFNRVMLFAQNKDLKGYCRRMTLLIFVIAASVVVVTFIIIPKYKWDDSFSYYCKVVSGNNCYCENNKEKKIECENAKQIENKNQKNSNPLL